jgi:hypothetical protein
MKTIKFKKASKFNLLKIPTPEAFANILNKSDLNHLKELAKLKILNKYPPSSL